LLPSDKALVILGAKHHFPMPCERPTTVYFEKLYVGIAGSTVTIPIG
jgi:hypothetical protein